MPKTRKPYPPEFREQLVALVRAGRTPEDLAREFEPTAQSISNWVAQSDRDAGGGPARPAPASLRHDHRQRSRRGPGRRSGRSPICGGGA